MKNIFAFVLVLIIAASFAACGTDEKVYETIEAKDCFYGAGYTELVFGGEKASEYHFKAEDSEKVEWSVYVFDEKFDDGFKYISAASEPVLIGDGSVVIEPGQYAYIYCSVNEFTSESPDENAKLLIYTE